MVHFGEFLKTWSLRSNSVTRQVTFHRTKIGGKRQNSNATFWVILKHCEYRNTGWPKKHKAQAKKVCQNCLVTLYFYFISLKRSIDKIHLQNVMSGSNAAFVMIQMINVLCFQEQSWCFLLITTTENGQKWFPLRHESSSKTFFTPYFNVFWLHLLYGILNTLLTKVFNT